MAVSIDSSQGQLGQAAVSSDSFAVVRPPRSDAIFYLQIPSSFFTKATSYYCLVVVVCDGEVAFLELWLLRRIWSQTLPLTRYSSSLSQRADQEPTES